MQQHELAFKDYVLGMKYKDIAEKYNVSVETVKSWRKRHGWSRDKAPKKGAPIAPLKKKKGCTPKNKGKPVNEEPDEELSEQEQLFCYHFVRTHNMTQAALLAGYGKGDKHSAQVLGSRLYHRPRVRQEIDRLHELFREELHVDIQDFLAYCMKVIGADIGDYLKFGRKDVPVMGQLGPAIDPKTRKPINRTMNFVDLVNSNMIDTSVIEEVKQGKDGISIKLVDKKWAWEQLTKYFDWLPDQWKRQLEENRLKVAQDKLAIEKARIGDDDEAGEEDNSFIEALAGKVPEVWNDAKE